MDWIPIEYRDFHDVPRVFVIQVSGSRYLFDCAFDDVRDDYAAVYQVYRLPATSDAAIGRASWVGLERGAEDLGEVPVSQVRFDRTRRAAVNASVLELLGRSREQAT